MDDTESAGGHSAKRVRDESCDESPEAKRLRAADRILLDILEEADPADRDSGDLASVMKIFEEEIAALSPHQHHQDHEQISAPTAAPESDGLGYLLEASDDDLGLPPTLPPSSDEGEGAAEGDARGLQGMGQLWGTDDGAAVWHGDFDFAGFAGDDGVPGIDDAVAFDRDLFDLADVVASGLSDYTDFSWRPESLPAV